MPRPIKPAIPNDCRYQETLIANTLRKWSAANQHGLQNPARSYKFDSLVPSEPDTLVKVSQRWAKRHRMRSEEQFMKLMNRMCYVYKYIYIYYMLVKFRFHTEGASKTVVTWQPLFQHKVNWFGPSLQMTPDLNPTSQSKQGHAAVARLRCLDFVETSPNLGKSKTSAEPTWGQGVKSIQVLRV